MLVSWELGKHKVDQRDFAVSLKPNASTEIWKGTVPGEPGEMSISHKQVNPSEPPPRTSRYRSLCKLAYMTTTMTWCSLVTATGPSLGSI